MHLRLLAHADVVGLVIMSLWPTWTIGWFVMAYPDSPAAQNVIMTLAAFTNVMVFALLGWLYSKFDFQRKIVNYLLLVPSYGVIYGVTFLVIGTIDFVFA